jgi:hypothetical protein
VQTGAIYTPPGPDTEAAIEVEILGPKGSVYFRIPFSAFSEVFHTVSDSRENMFRAFSNPKYGILPKLSKRLPQLSAGGVYTVTAKDLRWDMDGANPAAQL